jgi:cystathionine gamma-synthase
MLSFELAGGVDQVWPFVGAVAGFTLAESLGGVESLLVRSRLTTEGA